MTQTNEQVATENLQRQATLAANIDLQRTLLHIRIAQLYIEELVLKNPNIKDTIQTGTFRTVREIKELVRKINNNTDRSFPFLTEDVHKERIWNFAAINELMLRIVSEEEKDVYEEFQDMLVDVFTRVFYAKKNRKHLDLKKYQAMFRMFLKEVGNDLHGMPSQFLVEDEQLYIQISHSEPPIEMK
jgi:NTP pyrophosphatase (non-canonical NTP hydrolase)